MPTSSCLRRSPLQSRCLERVCFVGVKQLEEQHVAAMSDVSSVQHGLDNKLKRRLPTDAPPEVPEGCDLPEAYKARKCRFCCEWSTARCPWELKGSILEAWSPLLPWARGTKTKPSGEICKVCLIAARLQEHHLLGSRF